MSGELHELTGQIARVHAALSVGAWLTLPELRERVGDSHTPLTSISANIRNLKKEPRNCVILKRRRGRAERGLFEYRLFKQDEGTPLRAA